MAESTEVKMARLEEKVKNLDDNVSKEFKSVKDSLKNIETNLITLSTSFLTKDDYYRDVNKVQQSLAEEKARRAPWTKILFTVIGNVVSFLTLGIVVYILVNGDKIFK